ncbi:MAG: hypothetical protein IT254_03045 [Chitinophagaceae bacterium]|nr:hypothetical protein [Bacteroidota bacterium]MBS1927224.1 hypothetical protein [Bacteroidota bacterium]MCC6257275.1 hypothetical protein [Chitinophagaceae bacterium]MCW5917531.1 hypothetical protein [Ferruginibacter sp.]
MKTLYTLGKKVIYAIVLSLFILPHYVLAAGTIYDVSENGEMTLYIREIAGMASFLAFLIFLYWKSGQWTNFDEHHSSLNR